MNSINIINEHLKVINKLNNTEYHSKFTKATNVIVDSLKSKRRVYFCGNGGSAADAQHLAAEFTGKFFIDRKSLPAEALHCNTSYITAVGNDYGYDYVYSRIIDGIGEKGDVLIGLSTSGNSKNIVEAFKIAQKKGIFTIGMTGSKLSLMDNFSDIIIKSPSESTPRIQESHILIGHILCEFVEKIIFSYEI